jgi:hypothetical protein
MKQSYPSLQRPLSTFICKQTPTSGIGALNPGIFRFGYDGGGPYLCMAINHGGGNFSEFCDKMHVKISVGVYLQVSKHMNILTNNTHFPFKAHTFNKQPVTILN